MLKICNNLDEYIENLVAESYELIFLKQRFSWNDNCNEIFKCNFVIRKTNCQS